MLPTRRKNYIEKTSPVPRSISKNICAGSKHTAFSRALTEPSTRTASYTHSCAGSFRAVLPSAVASPAVVDRLKGQGMFINLFCGADFGKFLADEHRTYTQFTAEFNIKP